MTDTSKVATLPRASVAESLGVIAGVFTPTVAKGLIIRRPSVVSLAEKIGFDTSAVQRLQRLRKKYGSGPLLLDKPMSSRAILLHARDVRRVLDETPEPFSPASDEKRSALDHFEPQQALVTRGPEREERRRINDLALDSNASVHRLSGHFLPIVDEESALLLERVRHARELVYDDFYRAWFRIIRRVVFGDSAREDTRITDLMEALRANANWAFLKPTRKDLRDELHRRIRGYLDRAEPGSLMEAMAGIQMTADSAPENQIPQWLFAFDPAAMATFRALALLAAHPEKLERARTETVGGKAVGRPQRPFLRAALLESLRLWPTTPMILRQTTRETEWENGVMPAETGILIFAPYFHRDPDQLPFANAFHPDLWLQEDGDVQGRPPSAWPLVPFSGGTAICPGRNLVLLLTSGVMAALLGDRPLRLTDPGRLQPGKLPGTLDNYTLRFELGG